MPISVLGIENRYLLITGEGDVGASDFIEANEHIYADLEKNISHYQIVDLSKVSRNDVSTGDIRRIANQDERLADSMSHMVVAIVAPTNLTYGFARMWEAFVENPNITTAVFKEMSEAQEWIFTMQEKLS